MRLGRSPMVSARSRHSSAAAHKHSEVALCAQVHPASKRLGFSVVCASACQVGRYSGENAGRSGLRVVATATAAGGEAPAPTRRGRRTRMPSRQRLLCRAMMSVAPTRTGGNRILSIALSAKLAPPVLLLFDR